jgi:hypothetical protein
VLGDLVRLILLILLLPIILILIGPLLILAVIRGYQPVGPIRLDASRYGPGGRVGALILGVLLWILVWGGLAWLAINAFTPPAVITAVLPTVPTTVAAQDTLTPTPIPATPTLVSLVELTSEPSTATPVIASDTPPPPSATPIPTASDTPMSPTATPSSTPTFTPTPTRPPVEIGTVQPENSNKREQAEPTATPTISPRATLSFVERQAVVEAVEEGNVLLQEAIVQGDEDNFQKMEIVWQDLAFRVAKNFAAKIHEQYAKPVEVQFEYVQTPTIAPQSSRNEVVVTSREKWAYGGPTKIDKEEIFDFIYTLTEKDGGWIITRYTYRNVSSPTSTSTPTSTATPDAQQ